LDPRGLGSLVHNVLARIDFASKKLPAEIADWCEHLAPQHVVFNANRAAKEATSIVTQFVKSPRGRELAKAKTLHREIEFLLPWPPTTPSPSPSPQPRRVAGVEVAPATEPPVIARYIRGYIDCLYLTADDKWHIVDYKTNDI